MNNNIIMNSSIKLCKLVCVAAFTFFSTMVNCQEYIENLNFNPALAGEQWHKDEKNSATAIQLPFFDDFSYRNVYPKQTLWSDNDVFVNNDLGYMPISIGVATFDALDAQGKLHDGLGPGLQGIADYLTSQPIRLDSIFGDESRKMLVADSVYLSFFYQPMKKIENEIMENDDDELCVDFYSSADDAWINVWSAKRFSLDTLNVDENNGRYFVEVKLPIVDTVYFNDDFRFRFYNKATLENVHSGFQNNASRWNIDYVYLNYGRTYNDTYRDVCFVTTGQSFLSDYYSMPCNQYAASTNAYEMMVDSMSMLVSNLDSYPHNVNYSYEVINSTTGQRVWNYNAGSGNINPFLTPDGVVNGSKEYALGVFPSVYPTSSADSITFTIKHVLGATDLEYSDNDTVIFKQKFYNYYAYDDGIPEYAYCLTERPQMMLSQRYKLNVEDTIHSVAIYFNAIYGENEPIKYKLCVWNDNLSAPDQRVYEQEIEVEYDSLNVAGYVYYKLDTPLYISKDNFQNLVFYIGLEKSRQTPMSIGFDVSRNSANYTYINYDGSWQKSTKAGTVMMRPYFGKPIKEEVGIEDVETPSVVVYPNPVRNSFVNVKFEETDGCHSINVYDNYGKLCVSTETCDDVFKVDLSGCAKGVYIMKIENRKNGKLIVKKLIVM